MHKSAQSQLNPDLKPNRKFAVGAKDLVEDAITTEGLEVTLPEDATIDGRHLVSKDVAFEAELEYDGYKGIEEYDNDEYSANVNGKGDDRQELNFSGKDRPEEIDENISEENVIKKQEN